MIVLGIDPGFSVTGYCIAQQQGNKISLLDYGFLKLNPAQHLSERIGVFHKFFDEKIKQHAVQAIALETPFLGKNAQNFLKLGYLRGILYLLANNYSLGLCEFAPREIKQAITGFGGAEKDQVARVIMRLFSIQIQPSKLDVTDAIAVTLCGLWQQKSRILAK